MSRTMLAATVTDLAGVTDAEMVVAELTDEGGLRLDLDDGTTVLLDAGEVLALMAGARDVSEAA